MHAVAMPTALRLHRYDMRPARSSATLATSDDRRAAARVAGPQPESPIAGALAGLAWPELQSLVVASDALLAELGGLDAWIAQLADWELDRRAGLRFPGPPPAIAIPQELRVASVVALTLLRDGYAESGGPDCVRIVVLLDAIIGTLPDRETLQCRPYRRPLHGATGKRTRPAAA